jgi:uncharacterized protein RhaS with RHS repeats
MSGCTLEFLRARYYDPGIGRFISKDPITFSLANYNYSRNNPARYVDPSGKIVILVVVVIAGIVVYKAADRR